MIAIGHLVGYGLGTIDLLKIFGTTLGNSQFKQVCLLAAAALLFAVGVTSYAVEERVLISTKYMESSVNLPWKDADQKQRRRRKIRRRENG